MKPLLLTAALLLAACAGTPPQTRYYTLDTQSFSQPEKAVQIQVETAQFLAGDALVYRDSADTLTFARHHLWAEPLPQAAAKALAAQMNRTGTARYGIEAGDQGRVAVTFHNFQGNFDGEVFISGYARFFDASGSLKATRNFSVRTAQQGDGYAAMVQAMNRALAVVAAQIIE